MSLPSFLGDALSCVVLTIRASDNAYGDDDDGYTYPERYRRVLAPPMP